MAIQMRRNSFVVVLAVCCIFSSTGCEQPVTKTILYDLDNKALNAMQDAGIDKSELVESLTSSMQHRLGSAGRVHRLKNGQIQVDLTGNLNPKQLAAIKRLISAPGIFEFRILASPVAASDQDVVEQATKLTPEEKELRVGGEIAAKWITGLDSQQGPPDLVVHRQEGDVSETLVLIDPLHVTGEYFTSVKKSPGQAPSHAGLRLTLNPKGSQLLQKLTTDNLPTTAGERHALALILDGKIIASPTINAAMSDNIILEGLPTEEVDALITILNEGTLPLPIREVSKP